jgi:hypothetical protein
VTATRTPPSARRSCWICCSRYVPSLTSSQICCLMNQPLH